MSITRYLLTILDRTSSPRRGQLRRRKSRSQLQDPPPKTFFVCRLQLPTFDLTLFAFQRPSLYAHHYPSFGISSFIHAPMTIICSLQRLSVFSWYRHATHEGVFSPRPRLLIISFSFGLLGRLDNSTLPVVGPPLVDSEPQPQPQFTTASSSSPFTAHRLIYSPLPVKTFCHFKSAFNSETHYVEQSVCISLFVSYLYQCTM